MPTVSSASSYFDAASLSFSTRVSTRARSSPVPVSMLSEVHSTSQTPHGRGTERLGEISPFLYAPVGVTPTIRVTSAGSNNSALIATLTLATVGPPSKSSACVMAGSQQYFPILDRSYLDSYHC